jgi:polar amino acid transport system substrate-binding protein
VISRLLAAIVLLPLCAVAARAADQSVPSKVLTAGVVQAPLYAIKDARGEWSGVSVDLWNEIAKDLKIQSRLREVAGAGDLIDGLSDGSIDISVGPVVMTPELETMVDFSHVYFTDRLGIAIPPQTEWDRWVAAIGPFLSTRFLFLLLGLAALLVAAGALMWRLEREQNPGFSRSPWNGVGSGFWWSVVTLTSVGYGDKVPKTVGGRAVATVWMVMSLVLASVFTATVTSRLAVSHLQDIRGAADLRHARVGAVQSTAAADYLRGRGLTPRLFPSTDDSLTAMAKGEIDATVAGLAILQYAATRQDPAHRIVVIPSDVNEQFMVFGLPSGSALRARINLAMLQTMRLPIWQRIRSRYLGASATPLD